MEDILYKNPLWDIRIREMVEIIPGKDKELSNLIILTILSAGAGEITPIFNKTGPGVIIFSSIDEIGTKFILDNKEITSDDFLIVEGKEIKFGLLFEDSSEHTLKVSLIDSTILTYMFFNNIFLTKVIISNSITSIGEYAFKGCTGLTSVTIPNSVTEIGAFAFHFCSGLTSVTIGNSVKKIGESAFSGCSYLASITSLAATTPTISNNTFYIIKSEGTLHVPAGSDYSAWMSTSDYYLGKYNWTKVEDA